MKLLGFASIAVLFANPFGFAQTTWYVPDDFPAGIQAAISDASVADGDTVIVRPGTYVENINFEGKAVTLRSELGPDVTIIDGGNPSDPDYGSVVLFKTWEEADSVLDGFTLTNGKGTKGGNNNHYGGGIFVGASPTIINNVITGNSATYHGGGIYVSGIYPIIKNNVISYNSSNEWGGGIYYSATDSPIFNNVIIGNSAVYGGGIACIQSFTPITNNIIAGNLANYGAGIFTSYSSHPVITNCTITGNTASGTGGGIGCYEYGNPRIVNTILWDNAANTGPEIWIGPSGPFTKPSFLYISYSDVEGGQASVYVDPKCTLNWGSGMIDADPLFAAGPEGDYYLSQIAAGQGSDSPCVDAGSTDVFYLLMDVCWTRTDGIPDAGLVDMGFHYGPFIHPSLIATGHEISEASGGVVDLHLHAQVKNAGRNYIVLGGVSGTSPGVPLPGGHVTLPLNWDLFTNIVINLINTPNFWNFMGSLDGDGRAMAQLNLGPVPGAAGVTLYFAAALNKPWDFTSNPVAVNLVP